MKSFPSLRRPVSTASPDHMDSPSRAGSERVIAFPFWGVVDISKIASVLGGKDQVCLVLSQSKLTPSSIRLDIMSISRLRAICLELLLTAIGDIKR